MIIRKATEKDLNSISKIWLQMTDEHEVYDYYFKMKSNAIDLFNKFFKDELKKKENIILVAVEKEVIGYIHAELKKGVPVFEHNNKCEIIDIAIDKDYRGKGIGKELIEAVEKKLKKGIIISLKVASSNKAVGFYKNLGYKEVMKQMIKIK